MPTLYILQGIAGSGKSTLAKKMIAEGKALEHIEADTWMVDKIGNYSFDPKKLGYCHMMCRAEIEDCLKMGQNVIQSNTNLRRVDLQTYFDLAEQYGYEVTLIRLNSNFGSIHNVPPEKVASMKGLLDRFDYQSLPEFVTVEEYYPEDEAHVEYLNQQSDQCYEECMEQQSEQFPPYPLTKE
jgi:hypothetical protein